MSDFKRIQFTTTINAPVATVWRLMLDAESYKQWTVAFTEGSSFEGSWDQGQKIKFLSPSGDGMVSEIAENRPEQFISIRHLGFISNGVETPWGPAYENYTFVAVPEGTKLIVDMDVTNDFEEDMQRSWPKALALLKQMSEAAGAEVQP